MTALAAARRRGPARGSSSAPSTRTRRSRRRAGCSSSSCGTTPVDADFRLRADALDLAGACAVVATVGTTSTSSVDPVAEIADACEREGVWLHVDAAYAGSAAVCPELRHHFAGWERADSIVVNPHKWLLTPMDCSTLWTRRPDDFRAAFSLVPEYLRVSEEVVEPVRGQSRARPPLPRAQAVGGAALLRPGGPAGADPRGGPAGGALRGVGARRARLGVSRAAALLARLLPARGARTRRTRRCSSVSTRRGEMFISHTKLNGRYVLRLAVGSARTTEDDVRLAWDVLRREAAPA